MGHLQSCVWVTSVAAAWDQASKLATRCPANANFQSQCALESVPGSLWVRKHFPIWHGATEGQRNKRPQEHLSQQSPPHPSPALPCPEDSHCLPPPASSPQLCPSQTPRSLMCGHESKAVCCVRCGSIRSETSAWCVILAAISWWNDLVK